MEPIRVQCFTNIDERKSAEWPRQVAGMPRVGEQIQGSQGQLKPILRIVGITHCWDDKKQEPYLRLELHK